MAVSIGSNLGAPGTRITKRLGLDDEVVAYILQAIVGSVAGAVILSLALVIYLILGWWALSIWFGLVGLLASIVILLYAAPLRPFWHVVLGNLYAVGILIPFVPIFRDGQYVALLGQLWYSAIGGGFALIWAQIAVIGMLKWYWYVGAAVGLLALWIKLGLKAGWKVVLVVMLLLSIVGIVAFSDADEWAEAWGNLKYLLIPYCIPPIVFSVLLTVAMWKEILFPNLEWTLNPISFEELRETGLRGLWFPGLFRRDAEEPPEQPIEVNLTVKEDGRKPQTKRARLPGSPAARAFYKAVHRGESFSLRTARKYGLGRDTFNSKIRDGFIERGLAEWNNAEHPEQGVKLLEAGERLIEHLALVGTTQ